MVFTLLPRRDNDLIVAPRCLRVQMARGCPYAIRGVAGTQATTMPQGLPSYQPAPEIHGLAR
jgi:hypothetical protein